MKLMRLKKVEESTGMSRSTIYRLIKTNEFPAPINLTGTGGRAVAWNSEEVDSWINSRLPGKTSAHAVAIHKIVQKSLPEETLAKISEISEQSFLQDCQHTDMRDRLAAAALTGIASSMGIPYSQDAIKRAAQAAYALADAMIIVRLRH